MENKLLWDYNLVTKYLCKAKFIRVDGCKKNGKYINEAIRLWNSVNSDNHEIIFIRKFRISGLIPNVIRALKLGGIRDDVIIKAVNTSINKNNYINDETKQFHPLYIEEMNLLEQLKTIPLYIEIKGDDIFNQLCRLIKTYDRYAVWIMITFNNIDLTKYDYLAYLVAMNTKNAKIINYISKLIDNQTSLKCKENYII